MKKLILIILLLSTNAFANKWEEIPCDTSFLSPDVCFIKRLWVPHGWLLIHDKFKQGVLTFYPDEKHEWKI